MFLRALQLPGCGARFYVHGGQRYRDWLSGIWLAAEAFVTEIKPVGRKQVRKLANYYIF
ncbi:hypothetical protein CEV33_2585 [Brucella grignonensis]|uniref:Uncharacterized protein n=1 Tax=Brucella grignonensis TaxID=94627 RepID=A0A256F1Z5_9HYPH|nr:hypothetical protein CEV33_2585 [Brucella grignonensis]